MAMNAVKRKRRGRPAGSLNVDDLPTAEARPSRCPKCGSSVRGPYSRARVFKRNPPRSHDGLIYTRLVIRRCVCECGLPRDDRSYEWHGADVLPVAGEAKQEKMHVTNSFGHHDLTPAGRDSK